MKTYIQVQTKRILRYLPGALAVMAILIVGLLTAFFAMNDMAENGEHQQKVSVGIVGAGDDPLVELAMSAMTALDSSQYTLDVSLMEEEDAMAALNNRTLSAYIEAPEGFVDNAMNGHITSLRFVTRAGATGLITVFRDEVTTVISDMVIAAQKGVYGLNNALKELGNYTVGDRNVHMTNVNLKLIDCILTRDGVVELTELGIGDGLQMGDYLLCGLFVLLMMLSVLPFAPLFIRRDHSLARMLAAKGRSATMQAGCDLLCWFVWLSLSLLLLIAVSLAAVEAVSGQSLVPLSFANLAAVLPVLMLVSSFSFMLYAVSTDLVSGVLLQFFTTLALCFVSGCMYPVFFFPETVQKAVAFLPTGAARTVLSYCVTGNLDMSALTVVFGYTAVFAVVGILLRVRYVKWGRV